MSMTQVAETEVMSGNVRDIVNRLSRDMTNRTPISVLPQSDRRLPQLYVATYAYTAQQQDEISFAAGDLIELIEDIEDGWSKGRLKSNGAVGMYPTNFVSIKSTTTTPHSTSANRAKSSEVVMRNEPKAIERTPSTVISDSRGNGEVKIPIHEVAAEIETDLKTKEMARVRFQYTPQHPDELALADLDVLIHVTNKNCGDAGWFEGELQGKKGLFPDNFVELVQVPPNTQSGTKFASLATKQNSLDRVINRPPPANPPQPAVPPKPLKMKHNDSVVVGSTVTPTATTSAVTSTPSTAHLTTSPATTSTPTSFGSAEKKNNFAAIRDLMSSNLKVQAPEQVASARAKSIEQRDRSSSVEGGFDSIGGGGAEPTFDVGSSGDQVTELQHITKNRARPPKSRPMSMVMNRNRSSDESPSGIRLSSPTSSSGAHLMSTSMFAPGKDSANSTPFKSPPFVAPPSSATKPALRPVISANIVEVVDSPKKSPTPSTSDTHQTKPTTESIPLSSNSEFVTRAEYDALADRVRMLEARLMAIEKLRL